MNESTVMHELLENLFKEWGAGETMATVGARFALIFGVILMAMLVNGLARRVLLSAVESFVAKTRTRWDDAMAEQLVFERLTRLAPAVVIYLMAPVMLPDMETLRELTQRGALAYMIIFGAWTLSAVFDAILAIYSHYEISRERPIRSYVEVAKIVVIIIAGTSVIAAVLDRSPWGLLSGFGAMTAVIMLVFKDSILGFVASIQLSTHDMVRPGDWVEMPKHGADGDVLEVTINTIKVQNWDKTITTVPTYAFISESFRNWRGMTESGGRRIKRAVHIDVTSVRFCDEEMLARFRGFQYLRSYLDAKTVEVQSYNDDQGFDSRQPVCGRRLTNLGTFRAYLKGYLSAHPKIHKDLTFLVRQLAPGAAGLPIEIYVFSADQVWANYEDIQADIFDHVLAVLPEFDLRVFQAPSGADVQALRGDVAESIAALGMGATTTRQVVAPTRSGPSD